MRRRAADLGDGALPGVQPRRAGTACVRTATSTVEPDERRRPGARGAGGRARRAMRAGRTPRTTPARSPGCPGSVTTATPPSNRPAPCGPPGCIATLPNVTPRPANASLTTSYAPALTPPEVSTRSTPAVRSASTARNCATSSGTNRRSSARAARVLDRGREHRPVGLVDLARLQRRARRDQLRARGQHEHHRTSAHRDTGVPDRRRDADLRGPEHGARGEHDVARRDVLRRPPHVRADLGRGLERDGLRAAVRLLHRHDRVGARGHRRTRS